MEMAPAGIKMLVIDIDGTLLDPEGKITPATRAAVSAAQQAGIIVTLATARRYCNTTKVAAELGVDMPLILYDGALIARHPGGVIVHSHPLSAGAAQQAVELLVRNNIQPIVHPEPATGLEEEIWTGPPDLDNLWLGAYFATFPQQMRRMPYAQLCTGRRDPLRVVAFAAEETITSIIPEVATLDCSWTTIKRGNYGSAEVAMMDPSCSKASGVAALARRSGIALAQVMALGDNNNDIQMLRSVGWGVAMGQASDEVKAAARAVTASNQQDGVAQAIERYALCGAVNVASNSLKRTTCL